MTLEELGEAADDRIKRTIGAFGTTPRGLTKQAVNQYAIAYSEINQRLQAVYANILSGVKPEDYYNEIIKYQRLDKLRKEIADIYNSAAVSSSKIVVQSSTLGISNKYYTSQYAVNWFVPQRESFFTFLPTDVIDVSVNGTDAVWAGITARKQAALEAKFGPMMAYQAKYGTLTSVLLDDNQKQLAAINNAITQTFIQGKSFRQGAASIKSVMNTSANNAMRIMRTEGTRNMNAGNYANQQYAESSGIPMTKKWIATLDDRTRQDHAELDGQEVGINEEFSIRGNTTLYPGNFGVASEDISCRCSTVEIVDGVSPTLRRGRDPETGKTSVASFGSFTDWARDNGLAYDANGILKPA